jgi:serine/threonine-protein kinase
VSAQRRIEEARDAGSAPVIASVTADGRARRVVRAVGTPYAATEAFDPVGDTIESSSGAPAMIGSYRVVSLLGKGGCASVYLGQHPVIGTKVAIKVIAPHIAALPDLARRFVQEARASSELSNPHIPRYFDFGVLDTGQPFAVMEYFAGETLASRLERERSLSLADTVEILRQVAGAMVRVHDARLVHRDLKPDNLFLTRTTTGEIDVKILDFGIAKALAPSGSTAQTGAGMVLGTPLYCAPEQAMGLEVGPSADVYALGATAYEMLIGRAPFEGNLAQVLGAKTTDEAPAINDPRVPAHVATSIARMLARDPGARTATMSEVLRELEAWQAPPKAHAPGPARRRSARWRTPIVAALSLAAGLVIAFALASRGDETSSVAPARPAPAPSLTPSPPAPTPPPAPPAAAPTSAASQPSPAPAAPAPRPVSTSTRPAMVAPAPTVGEGSAAAPAITRPARRRVRPGPTRTTDGVIVDPFNE